MSVEGKKKKPNRKYSVLKKHIYTNITTKPSRGIKNKTHMYNHIRGILKKLILVVVTTENQGVTESDVNDHLRCHSKTTPILVVHLVRNTRSPLQLSCLHG